ncbi:MAG: flavin reductase [Clostridia bacterium]|nr:flavin reductase [Clostridia bacterium]
MIIDAKELKENFIKDIANEYMLVAAGDKSGYNMMTASWGFAGEMWGNDCMLTVIRPTRYTLEFVNKSDYFTLSFYGDNREIHKVCGSKSGRDVDKAALAHLTPVFDDNTVYFKEARMVIVCKKQYVQQMKEDCFTDKEPLKWYNNDLHYMIIGKIEKVIIND